jgi:type VI secretion system protein ImpM
MGIYGKLPSHGDFLARNLGRSFTEPWDQWLQQGIMASQAQLEERWLESYLVSPIWRFALSENICGEQCWAGVMMPSVDRVGRYFPLTIAAPLPPKSNLLALFRDHQIWFSQCERLALDALNEVCSLDQLLQNISDLEIPALLPATRQQRPLSPLAWHLNLPSVDQLADCLPELGHNLLIESMNDYSLWCHEGGDGQPSSLLVCDGLPPVQGYASLLDGNWSDRGWGGERTVPIATTNSTGEDGGR